MNHIDEKILELYVLRAKEVKDQRANIAKHLKRCASCEALRQEISTYYAEVERLQEEAAESSSTALSLRDRIVRVSPFLDRPPARTAARTIAARAGEYVFRHPVISSLSFVAALAAGLLLLFPREAVRDLNPAYARAKEEFLVAYNEAGEEVWRKRIGYGYDLQHIEKMPTYLRSHPERALTTLDVDGDGMSEVVGIFGWVLHAGIAREFPLRNSVICFNPDGSERWKYEFQRQMTIGGVQYSDDYRFYLMTVGDYDQDGSPEVIAAAGHITWFPNAIVRLRATDGSLISEYWHNGWFPYFAHKDIDGDGIEELLFAGENNQFQRGSLVVFDPRRIEGHGPAPEGYVPQGMSAATEKYYVLFPATDLEKFWELPTNKARLLQINTDGLIEVHVIEQLKDGEGDVIYYFDSSLRCVRALGSDSFTGLRRMYENEGKVTRKLDEQYYEEVRQGVRYWDGEKFVRDPTMNKRYLEAMKMLP